LSWTGLVSTGPWTGKDADWPSQPARHEIASTWSRTTVPTTEERPNQTPSLVRDKFEGNPTPGQVPPNSIHAAQEVACGSTYLGTDTGSRPESAQLRLRAGSGTPRGRVIAARQVPNRLVGLRDGTSYRDRRATPDVSAPRPQGWGPRSRTQCRSSRRSRSSACCRPIPKADLPGGGRTRGSGVRRRSWLSLGVEVVPVCCVPVLGGVRLEVRPRGAVRHLHAEFLGRRIVADDAVDVALLIISVPGQHVGVAAV